MRAAARSSHPASSVLSRGLRCTRLPFGRAVHSPCGAPRLVRPSLIVLLRFRLNSGRARATSVSLTLHSFAQHLAATADAFCLFAGPSLRWLLIGPPELHLAKRAFALHLLLEHAQGGIHVIVADEYLH